MLEFATWSIRTPSYETYEHKKIYYVFCAKTLITFNHQRAEDKYGIDCHED